MTKGKGKEMKKKSSSGALAVFYANYGVFFILLLVVIGASFCSDKFFTVDNLLGVINQNCLTAIMACGMTMLLISANMDLACGQAMIMANVACALVLTQTGNVPLAIAAAILIAVAAEAVNGYIISYLGLNGFIATLAMQFVFKGIGYLLVGGTPIYGTPGITFLAQSQVFGVIPILIVFMLICAVITHLVLTKTSFGRYIYAIGGNRDAAQSAGINVKLMVLLNFVVMGIFVGITAVLYTARANSGQPAGTDLTFDAIIATVLGGTSMAGGSGMVAGTIAGALVVGIINNVMNLAGVSVYYQSIVKGLIIFLAILVDKKTRDTIMKV